MKAPRRRKKMVALVLFPCATCSKEMQKCRCVSGFRVAEEGRFDRDERRVYETMLKERETEKRVG